MLNTQIISGGGLIALPTGGLAALPTAVRFGFDVPEPEMFVRFKCQLVIESGADDVVDFGLLLDGTLINGGALMREGISALPAAETHKAVSFEWFAKISQGSHVVELVANQVGAASENIDTAVAPLVLSVEKVSNIAILHKNTEPKYFHGL